MDPLWLFTALFCGFLVKQIQLPPMVGFLVAGFALNAMGVGQSEIITSLANLGITLLLFTIGLKLRLGNLLQPEVWGISSLHMLTISGLVTLLLLLPGIVGLAWLDQMTWKAAAVISFALSFSSTVFAVKILEDRGEMKTRHGQITIGILIIQDIIAVIFLTLATGKIPSIWALGLLALPLLRPILGQLMLRSGHNEVLVLFGLFMAIGGGELFHLVGMKADLGALIFGILLGGHPKTNELFHSLLRFKDLFLVGFFLSIGLSGLPSGSDIFIAAGIVLLLLPLKSLMFFALSILFKLRARTAYLTTSGLSNYSEFGLIVATVGVSAGWIDQQWLMVIAIALSLSFVVAAIVNTRAHDVYARYERLFHRFETKQRLPKDLPPTLGDAEILIIGMGRVGSSAYLTLSDASRPQLVCGLDADSDLVTRLQAEGQFVVSGDAEDIDFWRCININKLHLIMLTMPNLVDMQQAITLIRSTDYQGIIAAITKYEDDRHVLEEMGVDATFNIYAEAGAGFAEHARKQLQVARAS